MTVRSWHLEGGPGWEYVRAKFTYENTSDRPMERVHVTMYIVDGAGQVRALGCCFVREVGDVVSFLFLECRQNAPIHGREIVA